MFKTNPPLPSADEIRAFRHDPQALRAAVKLRADLSQGIRLLEPETLLSLARQYFPGEDAYQALVKFGLEATATLRELAAHGEDVRSIAGAEAECLAPLVAAATRRVLEIPHKLEGIGSSLRFMDADINERRENLRKAGVKPDEVEHLIAQGTEEREARRAALNTERTALLAEQESLARFLKTRDEQHLPAGFTASEPVKASAPLPALPEMPPLYRVAA